MNNKSLISILKNSVVHYIASRYATYIVQFINSLLIAVFLGPFYLGIWGFFNLILQYFNQLNFGISYSFNALASIHKKNEEFVVKTFNTALTLICGLCIIVLVLFTLNFWIGSDFGLKYNFYKYSFIVCFAAISTYLINLFSSLFRVYGRITEIAISQSLFPFTTLGVLIFYHGEDLLTVLMYTYLVSYIISLLVFILQSPIKFSLGFDIKTAKLIQIKGVFLFLYNASFYLIAISTRSFVSSEYSVEEFGYFTFAFSLSNVILLLFQSFSYLIYPKILNRLAHATNDQAIELIERIKTEYVLVSHFLVHFVILIFPLFLYFFPKYSTSLYAFNLCALSVVLYTNCFGYQGYLISKAKERKISFLALASLSINLVIAYWISAILKLEFYYVILSTAGSYIFFITSISYYSRKFLGANNTVVSLIESVFPIRLLIPYLISLILILLKQSSVVFILPMAFFIFFNFRYLGRLRNTFKQILHNKNLINI